MLNPFKVDILVKYYGLQKNLLYQKELYPYAKSAYKKRCEKIFKELNYHSDNLKKDVEKFQNWFSTKKRSAYDIDTLISNFNFDYKYETPPIPLTGSLSNLIDKLTDEFYSDSVLTELKLDKTTETNLKNELKFILVLSLYFDKQQNIKVNISENIQQLELSSKVTASKPRDAIENMLKSILLTPYFKLSKNKQNKFYYSMKDNFDNLSKDIWFNIFFNLSPADFPLNQIYQKEPEFPKEQRATRKPKNQYTLEKQDLLLEILKDILLPKEESKNSSEKLYINKINQYLTEIIFSPNYISTVGILVKQVKEKESKSNNFISNCIGEKIYPLISKLNIIPCPDLKHTLFIFLYDNILKIMPLLMAYYEYQSKENNRFIESFRKVFDSLKLDLWQIMNLENIFRKNFLKVKDLEKIATTVNDMPEICNPIYTLIDMIKNIEKTGMDNSKLNKDIKIYEDKISAIYHLYNKSIRKLYHYSNINNNELLILIQKYAKEAPNLFIKSNEKQITTKLDNDILKILAGNNSNKYKHYKQLSKEQYGIMFDLSNMNYSNFSQNKEKFYAQPMILDERFKEEFLRKNIITFLKETKNISVEQLEQWNKR